MTKYSDQPLNEEFKPTKADYDKLRAGMSKYTLTRINGRLQDPFYQYMKELGILYFDKYGDKVLKEPELFNKQNQLYANIQAADLAEEDRMFKQFPEQAGEAMEKVRGHIKSIRESVFGLGKNMTV